MLFKKDEPAGNTKPGKDADKNAKPEKLKYSHYYEQDGALRAYANRAMLIALLSVPATLVAIGLATYVRIQPPTVIRVNADGTAAAMGSNSGTVRPISVSQGSNTEPNEFERRACAKLFLEKYLNFSPDSVNRNWADGLNMMTANLRGSTLAAFQKDNVVGRIQDDQITSVFHLLTLEPAKDDPLSFTAYGVRDLHHVHDHNETTDKLVGEFHIRLITEKRSDGNPSGLLIAEYQERLITGERRDAMMRDAALNNPN
jgi:hypothetical protein